MKAKIVNDILTIEIPLQAPKKSKSGKSYIIATSSGASEIKYEGKDVYLSLNAYVNK